MAKYRVLWIQEILIRFVVISFSNQKAKMVEVNNQVLVVKMESDTVMDMDQVLTGLILELNQSPKTS